MSHSRLYLVSLVYGIAYKSTEFGEAAQLSYETLGENMSRSTVTWFSNTFKPTENELFLVAVKQSLSGDVMVFSELYRYAPQLDRFVAASIYGNLPESVSVLKRDQITYWAYVPQYVDVMREGKQSQIPEEK